MNEKVFLRKIFRDNVRVPLLINNSFSYRRKPLVNSPTHTYTRRAAFKVYQTINCSKNFLLLEGHIVEDYSENDKSDA